METWKTLETFDSEAEARVVQSRLEAEGLATQLLGSHAKVAGLVPAMLRLMVLETDFTKAAAILEPERAGERS